MFEGGLRICTYRRCVAHYLQIATLFTCRQIFTGDNIDGHREGDPLPAAHVSNQQGRGNMNAATIRETETVTRSIARWGSLAAAVVLGVGFATDERLSWSVATSNLPTIGLMVVMFVGYAIAWTERFEVAGSLIAVAAMIAIAIYTFMVIETAPDYFPLALGIPALFHLVAVAFHKRQEQP